MATLSARDLERLKPAHPSFTPVLVRAAEICPFPFFVAETLRGREQCMINYGKGRTGAQCAAKGIPVTYAQPKLSKVTWLVNPFSSKHCRQKDGFSHAMDLYKFPFNPNQSREDTKILAEAVLQAAKELGVPLRWGKDWNRNGRYEEKGETDGPHFERI